MSKRKRVQWAVIGWLCKISNSLGNLCIKLTLAYCLEYSVCDVKTLLSVFLFSYFSSACADINTSEEDIEA